MKLTSEDKALLLDMGHSERDFEQIEEAASKTTYKWRGKQIGREKALGLLGRGMYLSGIGRSAFHCTAVRFTPQNEPVHFDSSRLFKAGKDT